MGVNDIGPWATKRLGENAVKKEQLREMLEETRSQLAKAKADLAAHEKKVAALKTKVGKLGVVAAHLAEELGEAPEHVGVTAGSLDGLTIIEAAETVVNPGETLVSGDIADRLLANGFKYDKGRGRLSQSLTTMLARTDRFQRVGPARWLRTGEA
jgi:hypothetical protein